MASAFDAVEVVRDVLRTLEQQFVVVSLSATSSQRGLSVAIGGRARRRSRCRRARSSSRRSSSTASTRGSVGVLGPTRMNYPQALATVEVVSDQLGRRLEEG